MLRTSIPWPLLVIFAAVTPLGLYEWAPGDASLPSPSELSGINTTTVPYLPVMPVEERDLPPPRFTKNIKVGKGDTLMELFTREGMNRSEAHLVIKVLSKHYNPKRIRPGQQLAMVFEPQTGNSKDDLLSEIIVKPDIYNEINIVRLEDDTFKATKSKKAVVTRLMRSKGTIKSSLYVAATDAGVPAPILMEIIRIFSWDVDFQRGIRKGDGFDIVYENLYTEEGDFARFGKVIYGNLILRGKENPLYRFKTSKKVVDYFNKKGLNARKTLMRTPINGARLSSGYGKRRHPILGYTKMHRGVDFAAPRGTPIYAGGSGTVVYRGRNGAYGNYIRIRHNGKFSTAYGHMRRFHPKVRRGSRVRQGQIIGYVGTTGRSTGPHLHYEILRHGRQANPMRIKMPSGQKLKKRDLAAFQSVRKALDKQLTRIPVSSKLAQSRATFSN